MVKIFDPQSAVGLSARKLDKLNYFLISGYKQTKYYGFKGEPYKIRVSTHVDTKVNDDVIVDLIFDYDTIEADVEVRTANAVKDFERIIKLKWNKRVK